jgi:hypothetical protein
LIEVAFSLVAQNVFKMHERYTRRLGEHISRGGLKVAGGVARVQRFARCRTARKVDRPAPKKCFTGAKYWLGIG